VVVAMIRLDLTLGTFEARIKNVDVNQLTILNFPYQGEIYELPKSFGTVA
jgi:hypothetical protein